MAEKRKRERLENAAEGSHKKTKGGFQVGPANLPDSTRKRHNDKKKKELIDRANLKKDYAKIKQQFDAQQVSNQVAPTLNPSDDVPTNSEGNHGDETDQSIKTTEASNQPHPDRVNLIDAESKLADEARTTGHFNDRRQKRHKYDTFSQQTAEAQKRKDAAEERRTARETAQREREAKIEAREKHRRAMAKARTGTGQRKLGRESIPLLDKVRRLVGQS